MSYQALHSSASGMEAHLFQLDTIANNLANAGTTAFKRSRVNFEDLFYDHLKVPGTQDASGQTTAVGISVGFGTRVQSTELDFRPGSQEQTGGDLDLSIRGEGFFQVNDGTGIFYTRAGNFAKNADGNLVLGSADRGRLLEPLINIPNDATEISINSEGLVSVLIPGQPNATVVGQIQTARFVNPQGLLQMGENLYAETDASGPALIGNPADATGLGPLSQGWLESSNTEPVTELVDLIKTQRNVELNSQALQAGDQLLQLLVNLRRP